MKKLCLVAMAIALTALGGAFLYRHQARKKVSLGSAPSALKSKAAGIQMVAKRFGHLPLSFEENRG